MKRAAVLLARLKRHAVLVPFAFEERLCDDRLHVELRGFFDEALLNAFGDEVFVEHLHAGIHQTQFVVEGRPWDVCLGCLLRGLLLLGLLRF